MSRRRLLAITRRILQQFRRDRRTLGLVFVAPLVILSAFYFLLRGGGEKPVLGVVLEDRGALAAGIAAELDRSTLVRTTRLDAGTAAAQLRDAKLDGYVRLGVGFTADAIDLHRVAPEIHVEGSQPAPAQTVLQAVTQATAVAVSDLASASGVTPPQLQPRVYYEHGGPSLDTLDYFGSAFIGLVVFFLVFVTTSVSFLRERTQGTLERLFASPLRRAEIVVGYMLGFSAVALVQALVVLLFSLYVLKVHNSGNVILIFGIELLMVLAAVNLGIFLSTFARTEFQAVQFIPIVILPQVLLSGVILPVAQEPGWMQYLSNVLPLTYAVEGLRTVMIKGADLASGTVQLDIAVMLAYCVALVGAAALTLRRTVA